MTTGNAILAVVRKTLKPFDADVLKESWINYISKYGTSILFKEIFLWENGGYK